MTKRRVDKEIGDAIELFESSFHVVPKHDSESGHTKYDVRTSPTFHSIRRLKQRHPDYRAGPVKVYTEQEIEDYVKSQELPQ